MNSDFRATVESASGVEGLELLDIVSATSSVLILRYFYFASAFLLTRHEIFGTMAKALTERRQHLSTGVVCDPNSGTVANEKASYLVSEEINQNFWGLQWDKMDMVNHKAGEPAVGGFLAVRHLETGCTYSRVKFEEHYTTESTLLGVRGWFDRLLLAGAYDGTPATGYTWNQVVDHQLLAIRFTDGLPPTERAGWKVWLQANFIEHALRRACIFASGVLNSVEPGSETFGAFLPATTLFFVNIDRRMQDAAPVAVVRRAFPTLMPAAPVQLAGTSSSSGGGKGGGGDGGAGGGGQDRGKGKGKQGHERPPGANKLAKMLGSGDLFLAGRAYDVKGVATKLGIDVDCLSKTNDNRKNVGCRTERHATDQVPRDPQHTSFPRP